MHRDLRSTVASVKRLWNTLYKDIGVKHYLPDDEDSCWSCIPPATGLKDESSRAFPGGDIEIIAEYWLRTHESIEKGVKEFENVTLIKHQEFVTDPFKVLDEMHGNTGLSPFEYKFPMKINPSTNKSWPRLLSYQEQKRLDLFIEKNRERIEALHYADMTLETAFPDKLMGLFRSIRPK